MIHSTLLLRLSAIIRHGSMRQAAAALHISQPALSQSIRELEAIVGTPLFERTPNGLKVTRAGTELGIHADIVTNEIQKTVSTVATLRTGGPTRYTVGASASICASALPQIADTMLDEGLVSELRIFEGMGDPLVGRLARGELDVVVSYLWNIGCANEDLTHEQVGVSEISVVCTEPVARRILDRGLDQLSRHRWVVMTKNSDLKQRFENFFSAATISRPRQVIETDSIAFALRLMQGHDYIAYMPLGHAGILDRERFVTLEIDEITWLRGIGVFWRNRAHQPPALARLTQLLRGYYGQPGARTLRRHRFPGG